MVTSCVVCGIKYGTANVSFHRFPKDSSRCDLWAVLCNCAELLNSVDGALNRSTRICSRHFEPGQFNGNHLRYGVNPTLRLTKC